MLKKFFHQRKTVSSLPLFQKERVGVIDIGSNTIRYVMFELEPSGLIREKVNLKVTARLRNHFDTRGRLTPKGVGIILDALHNFEAATAHYQMNHIISVATAALRQAQNKEQILDQINQNSSFSPKILSEEEEAYFGFLAVVNSTYLEDGYTIDIGGGSTEISFFLNRKMVKYHSFPFGSLTLKQDFVKGETPTSEEMRKIRTFLERAWKQLPWLQARELPVVGIGGTARNLALMHKYHYDYPFKGIHQYIIKPKEMEHINDMLASLPLSKRKKVDGLSKERADIIIPSIQTIHSLTQQVDAPFFMLSRKGLREGIIYQYLFEQFQIEQYPTVKEESIYQLQHTYQVDFDQVDHLTQILKQMFDQLKSGEGFFLSEEDWVHLRNAAAIVYIQDQLMDSSSNHLFYMLTCQSLNGFSHRDQCKLALIASFKNRVQFERHVKPFSKWYSKEEVKKLELMGAMMRIALALNLTRRPIVQKLLIEQGQEALIFHVVCRENSRFEEQEVNRRKKHLERVLGRKIVFRFQ
ncbi:exopolyphosphatase [Laceyella putida]|uniref:Exopolyphosphatase n=1 Tax=Laceyella putida TaxID=110101 RepID=A0ABW2RMI8_9BACL